MSGRATSRAKTPSGSNPGGTPCTLRRLRTRSPEPDDEDERQSHLGHEERSAKPLAGSPHRGSGPALAQGGLGVETRRLSRRRQAEEGARHHARGEREEEDEGIDSRVGEPRDLGRRHVQQRTDRPGRQREPERPSQNGQQEALGQELLDEPAAAGPERRTDRELPLPRRGACEQQVCDVGAGQEEDEADRAEEHPEHRPDLAEHRLGKRDRRRSLSAVSSRMVFLELGHDAIEIGAGGAQRDAGGQPPQDAHSVVVAAIQPTAVGPVEANRRVEADAFGEEV